MDKIKGPIVEAILASLIVEMPFLSLPIVKQLTAFLIDRVLSVILKEGDNAIYAAIVEGRVNSEAKRLKDSIDNGDVKEIEDSASDLIHIGRKNK